VSFLEVRLSREQFLKDVDGACHGWLLLSLFDVRGLRFRRLRLSNVGAVVVVVVGCCI
jgi:hypothetical protein